ncbi:NAD-dependent dehydratase, partial [Limnoraphis robusta CCNP1324]|nr:NAD-dependent dehydratase [Limnoraphis robusta CCNP1324]
GRTEDNIRIRDLASLIAGQMPGCSVEFAEGACPDYRSYRVDCSKARDRLPGFAAKISLEDGIREVIETVTASDIAGLQFEENRYGRIAHLRHRLAAGSVGHDLRVCN